MQVLFIRVIIVSVKHMKVSVIVYTYDESFYLYSCLESLMKQTMKDFEIIIVNDGDSENVSKVITNFVNQFKGQVTLIHDAYVGIGEARNKGLRIAVGEYIKFLDSEDTLENNALEVMYREAKIRDADCLIAQGYYQFLFFKIPTSFNIENGKSFVYEYPNVGNKLFKRSVLLDNEFLSNTKWEDLSNIPYLMSLNMVTTNYNLYNYRIHFNTTIKDFFKTDELILDIIKVLEYLKPKLEPYDFRNIAIIHTLFRLENLFYSHNKDEKLKDILKNYLYSIDNYWADYEIVKIYASKNFLFRFFLKHSYL